MNQQSLAKLFECLDHKQQVIPTLLIYVTNDNPILRTTAITLLGQLPTTNREALSALTGLLDDEHFFVREAAMNSLTNLAPQALQHLPELLSDPKASKLWLHLNFIHSLKNRGNSHAA